MKKYRACLFCGSQKVLTNEHVFPQWLLKYLNVPNTRYSFTRTNAFGAPKSVRNLTYYNLTNGNVCSKCNNGWMSSLEQEMKDKYSTIFKSPIDDVDIFGKKLNYAFTDFNFKLWIYKTAILYNSSTDFYDFADDFHYKHSLNNSLPKNLMIRIGISSNADERVIQTIQSIPIMTTYSTSKKEHDRLKTSFSITIQINHLLFNVCYIHSDYEVIFDHFSGIQIYPEYISIEKKEFLFCGKNDLYKFHIDCIPHINND